MRANYPKYEYNQKIYNWLKEMKKADKIKNENKKKKIDFTKDYEDISEDEDDDKLNLKLNKQLVYHNQFLIEGKF